MHIASTLQESETFDTTVDLAVANLRGRLDGRAPHVLLLHVTPHFTSRLDELVDRVRAAFPDAVLAGCVAQGVVGSGQECLGGRAVSLTAMHLPDVDAQVVCIGDGDDQHASSWHQRLGIDPAASPFLLVLADPGLADPIELLESLDEAYPSGLVLGGLANSGNPTPSGPLLCTQGVATDASAVVLALHGNLQVDAIVAQGGRPIGAPLVVTRTIGGAIAELDGRPALRMMQATWEAMGPREQQVFRHSPSVGVGVEGAREHEFLVRDVTGVQRDTGSFKLSMPIKTHQLVRFVVRDPDSARQELDGLVQGWRRRNPYSTPAGAIMISCLGRGQPFFGVADHDPKRLREGLGLVPISGFFAAGELGPVGSRTYLHSYTTCFAIFSEPRWD